MSNSAESDATYRDVLGLFLEHVHIGVSNDSIVVEDVTFFAPPAIRAALGTLMDEWIDAEAPGVDPPGRYRVGDLVRYVGHDPRWIGQQGPVTRTDYDSHPTVPLVVDLPGGPKGIGICFADEHVERVR